MSPLNSSSFDQETWYRIRNEMFNTSFWERNPEKDAEREAGDESDNRDLVRLIFRYANRELEVRRARANEAIRRRIIHNRGNVLGKIYILFQRIRAGKGNLFPLARGSNEEKRLGNLSANLGGLLIGSYMREQMSNTQIEPPEEDPNE